RRVRRIAVVHVEERQHSLVLLHPPSQYGKLSCSNYRGVPEAALNTAVLNALHEVVADPDVLWTLLTERAERWRRDRALQSDERANLEGEEARLEQAIGRLLDHMEAGEDVEKRLKQRRAELDELRVRL